MKHFLAYAFVVLCLCACGDDDSSFVSAENEKSADDFECSVTTGNNSVAMYLNMPGQTNSSVKFVFNDDGSAVESFSSTVFGKSKKELNALCDSLDMMELYFKKDSYSCDNGHFSFKIEFDSESAPTKSSAKEVFEQQCSDNEDEWNESKKDTKVSSSRIVESSSSNEKVTSSSSEESSTNAAVFEFDGAKVANREVMVDSHTLQYESFKDSAQKVLGDSSADAYAISIDSGTYYSTGWELDVGMDEGSLEFFFKPHEDFVDTRAYALVGTEGARLLVYYDNGNLVFMMNETNKYDYIKASANVLNGWNFVCAQWINGKMSLYLNGAIIGSKQSGHGYVPSTRNNESEIIVGFKNSCCMEDAGQKKQMYTAVDFGPMRLSNIAREKPLSDIVE